jgi:hypothetical protein
MATTAGGFEPRYIIVCYDCRRNETRTDTYYTNGGTPGNGGYGQGWDYSRNYGLAGGAAGGQNAGAGGRGGDGGGWGEAGATGLSGGNGNNGAGGGGTGGGQPGAWLIHGGRVQVMVQGDARGRVE